MEAEQNDIDRQRCCQLLEDFVAQALIGLSRDETGGLGPCRRSFDQRETLALTPLPRRDHGGRT